MKVNYYDLKPITNGKHLCDWCDKKAVVSVKNASTDWRELACQEHLEKMYNKPE